MSDINTNLNTLTPNKYRLVFDRIPHCNLFAQKATLPGLSISAIPFNTRFNPVPVPGNKVTYESFSVSFIVDEDLTNWRELFNWIKRCSVYDAASDLANHADETVYSDATLMFLTNNSTSNKQVRFQSCFPTNLTSIDVDTTSSESTMVATATFVFVTMVFE